MSIECFPNWIILEGFWNVSFQIIHEKPVTWERLRDIKALQNILSKKSFEKKGENLKSDLNNYCINIACAYYQGWGGRKMSE